MQMKHHVLDLLKNFMLGEAGKKLHPHMISVEMASRPKALGGGPPIEKGHDIEDVPLNDGTEEEEHHALEHLMEHEHDHRDSESNPNYVHPEEFAKEEEEDKKPLRGKAFWRNR